MKITKELILSWEPCEYWTESMIYALIKKYCGRRKVIKFEDMVSAYKSGDLSAQDFNWLVLHPEIVTERKLHDISIFCWEKISRPIWEKHYPDDKRPHEAVRIKKLWLNGKASDGELSAARDAARDAVRDVALIAVRDVALIAVRDVALIAVRAAVRDVAGSAAWDAARDAARAAVRDVAWDAAHKKISNYIIKIMGKE